MRILGSWAASYEFACHSSACRPPTSGGTGGSTPGKAASIQEGAKTWWRMMGGSVELTTAAYKLFGIPTSRRSGDEAAEIARGMIDAINTQPVLPTRLFSGHEREPGETYTVGQVIDIPLMALAYSRKLSEVYADVGPDRIINPLKYPHGSNVMMMMRLAYPKKSDEQIWNGLPDNLKDKVGQSVAHGRVISDNRAPSVGVMYHFATSRSALIRHGTERVTSGRYKVSAVDEVPRPGTWNWDQRTHSFVPATFLRVMLDYVEPLGT